MVSNRNTSSSFCVEDRLSKLIGDRPWSARWDNWLWLYLSQIRVARYDWRIVNRASMRDLMADSIEWAGVNPHGILEAEKRLLLPDDDLSWITDCKRQHEWIKNKILQRSNAQFGIPESFVGRDYVLAMIDCWDVLSKLFSVTGLQRDWIEQLKQDRQLDWVKERDEREACGYIWDWLRRNQLERTFMRAEPVDHLSMLMFFDASNLTDIEKKHCIAAARKLWRQDIRRNSDTGKDQLNVTLSKKAIGRLDKFCKKHDLSRSKVLEVLLMMEEEKGIYIAERLRILREIES